MVGMVQFTDTLDEMKNILALGVMSNYKAGNVYITLGEHQINDGGAGVYYLSTLDYLYSHHINASNVIKIQSNPENIVILPISFKDVNNLHDDVNGMKNIINMTLK